MGFIEIIQQLREINKINKKTAKILGVFNINMERKKVIAKKTPPGSIF
jgi:hypothetical protein